MNLHIAVNVPVSNYPLPPPRRMMGKDIILIVAEKYGISVADLLGKSRGRAISLPRQEAMWRVRHGTKLTYPQIGKLFNRDHATIMYGCQQFEARQ